MASRSELAAECHRLYALLHPQGRVQVMLPAHDRATMEARYRDIYAQLAEIDADAAAAQETAQDYLAEVEAAIPQLVGMLPGASPWKGRVEALLAMPAGAQRDDAMRAAFSEIASGEALAKLGPVGLVVKPMLDNFLRKSKRPTSTRRMARR